jgi:hypothetical protein
MLRNPADYPFPSSLQTDITTPCVRDKPAAYVAYERSLAKTKQPTPARMARGLRIYMRGVVATRPCRHCSHVAANRSAKNKSRDPSGRRAFFGGLCVMPGKAPREYGGCCACIAAGVPGCSAECQCYAPPSLVMLASCCSRHWGFAQMTRHSLRRRRRPHHPSRSLPPTILARCLCRH